MFIHIDTDAHTTIFVIKCLHFLVATSYCRRGDSNPAPSGTAFAKGPNFASDSRSISEICRNYYQECIVGTTTFTECRGPYYMVGSAVTTCVAQNQWSLPIGGCVLDGEHNNIFICFHKKICLIQDEPGSFPYLNTLIWKLNSFHGIWHPQPGICIPNAQGEFSRYAVSRVYGPITRNKIKTVGCKQ